jgi:phosphoglycolate phosphatase-like HAD superfamily hydrolase
MLNFSPQHPYLVAIDSDGCVFDSMEIKHKECFIPNFINAYGLQAVSKYARETWEFVNLYSQSRGLNRFPALLESLERLQARPEVAARGVHVPFPKAVQQWVATESRLGNPALQARVAETKDPEFAQCLAWSQAVNRAIDDMVRGVPPFPFVRECLAKLKGRADLMVCSATPRAALKKEWQEHHLDGHVAEICGQEAGSKKELLTNARKYAAGKALMIGDAPGDHAAAVANQCLFFPINPGHEEASWQELFESGLDRFLAGTFAGEYQERLLNEFFKLLPREPHWRTEAKK